MGRIVARNQVPEKKKNRRIFHGTVGVTTVTWLVPPGVTEVEVHCWGAGGNGGPTYYGGGGGGGGYVTHIFPVTSSDRLLITAGASPGGTSSVSVPTQSPISPISATGGSTGVDAAGAGSAGPSAPGGTGSFTIAPGISTARTFAASGGAGGAGYISGPGVGQHAGGGGAAGSPFGTGGAGAGGPTLGPVGAGGGGGIGGAGLSGGGGGGSLGAAPFDYRTGGAGRNGIANTSTTLNTLTDSDDWFYVDEILGAGGPTGTYAGTPLSGIPGEAGGGGGCSVLGGSFGGNGGILGGGGSAGAPGSPNNTSVPGNGGLAGGGAGNTVQNTGRSGAGLVILYW